MQELLRNQGITIEAHGEDNCVVVQQSRSEQPTLYGRDSSGKELPIDPFQSWQEAFDFALTLAAEDDEHDLLWRDTGGEG